MVDGPQTAKDAPRGAAVNATDAATRASIEANGRTSAADRDNFNRGGATGTEVPRDRQGAPGAPSERPAPAGRTNPDEGCPTGANKREVMHQHTEAELAFRPDLSRQSEEARLGHQAQKDKPLDVNDKGIHVVQKYETVYDIAKRDLKDRNQSVSEADIAKRSREIIAMNTDAYPGLAQNAHLIQPGWELRVRGCVPGDVQITIPPWDPNARREAPPPEPMPPQRVPEYAPPPVPRAEMYPPPVPRPEMYPPPGPPVVYRQLPEFYPPPMASTFMPVDQPRGWFGINIGNGGGGGFSFGIGNGALFPRPVFIPGAGYDYGIAQSYPIWGAGGGGWRHHHDYDRSFDRGRYSGGNMTQITNTYDNHSVYAPTTINQTISGGGHDRIQAPIMVVPTMGNRNTVQVQPMRQTMGRRQHG